MHALLGVAVVVVMHAAVCRSESSFYTRTPFRGRFQLTSAIFSVCGECRRPALSGASSLGL